MKASLFILALLLLGMVLSVYREAFAYALVGLPS